MPFPNMAARPGRHPRGGRALSQHGGNLRLLPALRPRLAFREAHADRFLQKPASRWARGRETPARDWSRGDDARRRGATRTRARARAQSRAFETRRRSVRPGRSLMRSRKVRGPAGGVRATEPHSPRGAGGGRAPLGLELRPWEENPHSPPAPGRGGGEETRASSRLRRGAPGSLPECRPPGPVLRPARCGLLPGLPGPPRSALRVSQAPVSDVT